MTTTMDSAQEAATGARVVGGPEVCRAANLGYLDPDSVDVGSVAADPEALVVSDAGEVLFRLRQDVGS
jgi:hypothetical protein